MEVIWKYMIVVEILFSLLFSVFIVLIVIFVVIYKWGNYFSRWNREFMRV